LNRIDLEAEYGQEQGDAGSLASALDAIVGLVDAFRNDVDGH